LTGGGGKKSDLEGKKNNRKRKTPALVGRRTYSLNCPKRGVKGESDQQEKKVIVENQQKETQCSSNSQDGEDKRKKPPSIAGKIKTPGRGDQKKNDGEELGTALVCVQMRYEQSTITAKTSEGKKKRLEMNEKLKRKPKKGRHGRKTWLLAT